MSPSGGAELMDGLEQARQQAGISLGDLWFRYFSVGGMSTALQLDAYLHGALVPSAHDRDLVALALNERFTELGVDHPIRYTDD